DGSGPRPLSVNNVNEFDPALLPDGRILFGRWEYVDKTALTQQSLWTVFPDGTNETALYANNMVHPEALLDPRPVPGAPHLVAATLAPHNAPPRGCVGIVDTRLGKNEASAIANFDRPDSPTHDRGESCEPWPFSADVLLCSGRPQGAAHNAILLADRFGHRRVIYADPAIDCHSPMPIAPRPAPARLAETVEPAAASGRFLVQDVYEGLPGVSRGEVAWLRVIEETSRVSPTPGGAFNQTFLISAILAFTAKNYLGVTPVEADGSAFFEVPSGRAVYLQALDREGRLVQSMRTFVQAAPGVTRSCVGCHEPKYAAARQRGRPRALTRPAKVLEPESWGSGFVDYPGMVQPVFDKHCVSCHGGEQGIAAGLDLSGGWTEYFSISYENLVARRETQLTATLIAGIDCMNGTSQWSAQILPPRSHGSGVAPLASVLVSGHRGRIGALSRAERDLVLAWIDSNGTYYGTWDYTRNGHRIRDWDRLRSALVEQMRQGGCMRCHGDAKGNPILFENDWVNLQHPEMSRILRAPLAAGGEGHGLGLCRDRALRPGLARTAFLRTGQYLHADQPLERFAPVPYTPPDRGGEAVVSLDSTSHPVYWAMLRILREHRRRALASPRVDMPGAEVIAGETRAMLLPPLPVPPPALEARADEEGAVCLAWERSARTIGLRAEVHRGPQAAFVPGEDTRLAVTSLFRFRDCDAVEGVQHYALVVVRGDERSAPIHASVVVPPVLPPPAPGAPTAAAQPGHVRLEWQEPDGSDRLCYHVYRAAEGHADAERLTPEPTAELAFADLRAEPGRQWRYTVRAVNRRGVEGPPSSPAAAAALPEIRGPVFAAGFTASLAAIVADGSEVSGTGHGKTGVVDGALALAPGAFVTYDHRPDFDLSRRLTVSCWVRIETPAPMPVVLSCGVWRQAGWFLQRIGSGWRWHVGGLDCDGGVGAPGRWTHLAGIFDGRGVRLYQDGRLVREEKGTVANNPWDGPLHVGQYSGGPGPQYQVIGRLARVALYARALDAEEIATLAATAPEREAAPR
ncbi:MAG: hypothetical protein JXR77_11870, partial [Lentisphaeria bacterium]|nr:hypothetical protein [Lentisphaeria bacterium]